MDRCESCRFWERENTLRLVGENRQCLRFPETAVKGPRNWCGEYSLAQPRQLESAPAGLQLREGMWARRRDGAVVGPVGLSTLDPERYPFAAEYAGRVYSYRGDGRMLYARESDHDLVEEVPAPDAPKHPAKELPKAMIFHTHSAVVDVEFGGGFFRFYDLTAAEAAVIEERRRQEFEKGYTAAHDDKHTDDSLADAAAAFAMSGRNGALMDIWPRDWGNPPPMCPLGGERSRRIRDLEKAAALCIAEIERLKRKGD